jgi:hypothetical protein
MLHGDSITPGTCTNRANVAYYDTSAASGNVGFVGGVPPSRRWVAPFGGPPVEHCRTDRRPSDRTPAFWSGQPSADVPIRAVARGYNVSIIGSMRLLNR